MWRSQEQCQGLARLLGLSPLYNCRQVGDPPRWCGSETPDPTKQPAIRGDLTAIECRKDQTNFSENGFGSFLSSEAYVVRPP